MEPAVPEPGTAQRPLVSAPYLEQKRNALDAWAGRIAFIVGDARDVGNVTRLDRQHTAA